jgi:hypothetical protein
VLSERIQIRYWYVLFCIDCIFCMIATTSSGPPPRQISASATPEAAEGALEHFALASIATQGPLCAVPVF